MDKTLKSFIFFIAFIIIVPYTFSQITTAEDFFQKVSDKYGLVNDYSANFSLTKSGKVMKGIVFYKSPHLLRMDFTDPDSQVLCIDNENFNFYIPQYAIILSQKLRKRSQQEIMNLASKQGLRMLRNNYSIGFGDGGGSKVALDESNTQSVIKLRLRCASIDEGFRELIIAIDENLMIRRITGITLGGESIQFDFTDIRINQNIPASKFKYTVPSQAMKLDNFIFEPEE